MFVETTWEGLIQAVADNQFDAAGDGITITDDRKKVVDFSIGYLNIDQRLLVRSSEIIITSINDVKSNPSFRVGVQLGTTNYQTAEYILPATQIIGYEQFPQSVQGLLSDEVDAVILDEVAGQGYLGSGKDQVKLVGPPISTDQLGFIFPRGSDLVEPVDNALELLFENGFIDQVNSFYFGPDFEITYDDLFPD